MILVIGLAKSSITGFGGTCSFFYFGGNCSFIKLISDGPTEGHGSQSFLSGVGGRILGKTGWNNRYY